MKKKSTVLCLARPKPAFQGDEWSWHNGGDIEIGLYVLSVIRKRSFLGFCRV
jgi:hypothetical protein